MGLAYIEGAGGGGVRSSDVTATAADILSGKTDLTSTSDDEVVQGTMPNNGTVNQTLEINGSYTIPAGYHSGSGKVSQNVTTKGAATYYATTADQTIAANQWLSGAQTIKKLTQTNLIGGNIKPGVVVKVNNGNTDVFSVTGSMASKGAGTYYATTADQTIAANQYLTGVQTIKKLTQSNLSSENILRGKTISIHNGNANVWSVTGGNNVLRWMSGNSKGSNTGKSFRITGGSSNYKWFYYVDVNPGFTPVFSISASNGLMFRQSQTAFANADSELINTCQFVNASDAPFSSTQCRIFFPQYDSSASVNVWYWIFGY